MTTCHNSVANPPGTSAQLAKYFDWTRIPIQRNQNGSVASSSWSSHLLKCKVNHKNDVGSPSESILSWIFGPSCSKGGMMIRGTTLSRAEHQKSAVYKSELSVRKPVYWPKGMGGTQVNPSGSWTASNTEGLLHNTTEKRPAIKTSSIKSTGSRNAPSNSEVTLGCSDEGLKVWIKLSQEFSQSQYYPSAHGLMTQEPDHSLFFSKLSVQ